MRSRSWMTSLKKPSHHVGTHSSQADHAELHRWIIVHEIAPVGDSLCSSDISASATIRHHLDALGKDAPVNITPFQMKDNDLTPVHRLEDLPSPGMRRVFVRCNL